jgi:hypothetical protein
MSGNNNNGWVDIPSQFTHSIKLSETAKGIRIDVHVYACDKETAITQAMETYLETREACKINEIPLAPIEVQEKK